jgi:hypothetical protein
MTHSQITVGIMKLSDKRMQTNGFAKAIRKYVRDEDDPDNEPNAEIDVHFRPDAYVVDINNQAITVYEVEDTNALSVQKIRDLTHFWFVLDSYSWDFRVVVTDRYGLNQRELNMQAYYYYFLSKSNTECVAREKLLPSFRGAGLRLVI